MSVPLPVTITFKRSMGAFTADATVEEHGTDSMVATTHPVEQGATITDHLYRLPAELTLEYVWSMGSPQNTTQDNTFLRTLYAQLLQTEADRTLLQVETGKRIYQNMALMVLDQRTDKNSENILMLRITLHEILFATTQIVSLSSSAVQAVPQKTAPVLDQGSTNLTPAPNYVQSPGVTTP
jgi:hypothetical protein